MSEMRLQMMYHNTNATKLIALTALHVHNVCIFAKKLKDACQDQPLEACKRYKSREVSNKEFFQGIISTN